LQRQLENRARPSNSASKIGHPVQVAISSLHEDSRTRAVRAVGLGAEVVKRSGDALGRHLENHSAATGLVAVCTTAAGCYAIEIAVGRLNQIRRIGTIGTIGLSTELVESVELSGESEDESGAVFVQATDLCSSVKIAIAAQGKRRVGIIAILATELRAKAVHGCKPGLCVGAEDRTRLV
jgi:hypothetical protein